MMLKATEVLYLANWEGFLFSTFMKILRSPFFCPTPPFGNFANLVTLKCFWISLQSLQNFTLKHLTMLLTAWWTILSAFESMWTQNECWGWNNSWSKVSKMPTFSWTRRENARRMGTSLEKEVFKSKLKCYFVFIDAIISGLYKFNSPKVLRIKLKLKRDWLGMLRLENIFLIVNGTTHLIILGDVS